MNFLNIVSLFCVTMSSIVTLARPLKSNHELYELNIGTHRGRYLKKIEKTHLDLYELPSLDSIVRHSIPVQLVSDSYPARFLSQFDDKSGLFPFLGIYSKEKNGEFFKIYYKENYYWAHKDSFDEITEVEDILQRNTLHFKVADVKTFNSPGGKEASMPKTLVKYLSTKDKSSTMRFKATAVKWVDNKLWVELTYINNDVCVDKKDQYHHKLKFWIHPYNEQGRPKYIYAYKGGC